MARGETTKETSALLERLKARLPRPPVLVVADFSQELEAAAKAIFPESRFGHDYFHAAQLLNRAILKELARLKQVHCGSSVVEYHLARRSSLAAEGAGAIPKVQFNEPYLRAAWGVYRDLHELGECDSPGLFSQAWADFSRRTASGGWVDAKQFLEIAGERTPKRGFTDKSYPPFLDRARKAWRRVVREARKPLEDQKAHYTRAKYSVLRNPANMTQEQHEALREHLAEFPWLRPIREAVRRFHFQFRAPRQSWRPLNFLDKIVQGDSHASLKAAVRTLTSKKDQIFAYREIWELHPHLDGNLGARTAREELNKRVNQVSRNQYGIRSTPSALLRLEHILACPMIVSEDLLSHEACYL